jgi:hypothetical protein
MNHRWRRIMAMLGFLGCLAMVSPACVVRARAHVRARPAAVYVVDEAPPPPRYRTVQPRAGYVWVRGHWEWRGDQWFWVDGHWDRARTGYTYMEGHWEQRGNRWHWVEGRWAVEGGGRHEHVGQPTPPRHGHVVVEYPTAAPPALRVERPNPRSGYLWVSGRWQWSNGNWEWVPGHWERARAGFEWEAGRWERQGDRFVWIEGRWIQSPSGPTVIDRRHGHVGGGPAEPPRHGHVGGGPAEPPRHGHVGGPTAPPPAPKAENPNARAGYVWVVGRWDWRGSNWEWIPGHWERARAGFVWQPGRWELQGNVYVWVEGQWVQDAGGSAGPKVRDRRRPAAEERPNEVVPSRRPN